MDERIRNTRYWRRWTLATAICAAPICVVTAPAMADNPSGSSVLKAQLAAGFGAGTNQGFIRSAPLRSDPSRAVIARPAARVLGQPDPVPRIPVGEKGLPNVGAPPVVVSEASDLIAESLPKLPARVRSLAELIRQADDGQASDSNATPENAVNVRIDSDRDSICVEFAPHVRRIELGAYNPELPRDVDPDAVVRFAEPLGATLLKKPPVKPIEVPRVEVPSIREKTEPVERDANPNSESLSDASSLGAVTEELTLPKLDSNDKVPPALMRALKDPELTGMIESTPEPESAANLDSIGRWNQFHSDRSRRLADISGFEMLPLDRIGSE